MVSVPILSLCVRMRIHSHRKRSRRTYTKVPVVVVSGQVRFMGIISAFVCLSSVICICILSISMNCFHNEKK